jgi:hypothetical protein
LIEPVSTNTQQKYKVAKKKDIGYDTADSTIIHVTVPTVQKSITLKKKGYENKSMNIKINNYQ